MQFSQYYKIAKTKADDWFDPILTVDTRLFIDPLLIYAQPRPYFTGAHNEIVGLFNSVFRLIAETRGDRRHPSWIRAVATLHFPEVKELCLGYASEDTEGAGSGPRFARLIAEALWEAVQTGMEQIEHFEEVALLRKGIGSDRISDIAGNILRRRFADYTRRVCVRHGIPVRSYRYGALTFSREYCRWLPGEIDLPENPYSGQGVLLTPHRFVRDLPSISGDPFWAYCFDNHNEVLRTEFGADISRRVDKDTIVSLAQRHAELRRQFVSTTEVDPPEPYDAKRDPRGRVAYYGATLAYCLANPTAFAFSTDAEFVRFVTDLVEVFRHYVEENGGWKLLWNDDGSYKSEEAAQNLFLGITKHHCVANNIDVSKEANIGRGPVDFKLSQGHAYRALIEVKMARNTKFWNGLEAQLPTYQMAEGVRIGVFLVVAQSETDFKKIRSIQTRVQVAAARTGYSVTAVVVDASNSHLSASKLTAKTTTSRRIGRRNSP